MEILMALLCAALLLWFNRLIFTRLISPAQQGTVPVFAVIPAVGDGDGWSKPCATCTGCRGKNSPSSPCSLWTRD